MGWWQGGMGWWQGREGWRVVRSEGGGLLVLFKGGENAG